jgi:hypothetical protein
MLFLVLGGQIFSSLTLPTGVVSSVRELVCPGQLLSEGGIIFRVAVELVEFLGGISSFTIWTRF